MMAIQNGAVATRSAAMPLGTHCSAHTTARLPMPTMRNPTSVRFATVRKSRGIFSPRHAAMPSMNTPATTKRMHVSNSGGIVSMAMRMARYVVPQTMQTTSQAR